MTTEVCFPFNLDSARENLLRYNVDILGEMEGTLYTKKFIEIYSRCYQRDTFVFTKEGVMEFLKTNNLIEQLSSLIRLTAINSVWNEFLLFFCDYTVKITQSKCKKGIELAIATEQGYLARLAGKLQ